MDEFGAVRWFVELAGCGSFTVTAAKFGVTPQAVSSAISRLERQLGTRLFQRTTRQVRLTGEGEVYLEKARQGLALLVAAAEQLKDMKKEPNGLIRLSSVGTMGRHHFLPALAKFLLRYPKVNIEHRIMASPPDLIREGLDLAIVRGQGIGDSNYATRPLCRIPTVLVASPAYLARRGVPRTPEELEDHEWVTHRVPLGSSHLAELDPPRDGGAAEGQGFTVVMDPIGPGHARQTHKDHVVTQRTIRYLVSDSGDHIADAVAQGMGIAILSENLALPYLRTGALKTLLPDHVFKGFGDIFIQYPHREFLPPKIRAFIDFMVAYFAAEPDLNCDLELARRYAAQA